LTTLKGAKKPRRHFGGIHLSRAESQSKGGHFDASDVIRTPCISNCVEFHTQQFASITRNLTMLQCYTTIGSKQASK